MQTVSSCSPTVSGRAGRPSAASALLDAEATQLSVIALGAHPILAGRYGEAQAPVRIASNPPATRTARTLLVSVARLRLVMNDVAGAWRAVGQARPATRGSTPAIECLVLTWEAAVRAIGDLEALEIHILRRPRRRAGGAPSASRIS